MSDPEYRARRLAQLRENTLRRREEARATGHCIVCFRRPVEEGSVCPHCREQARQRAQRNRERYAVTQQAYYRARKAEKQARRECVLCDQPAQPDRTMCAVCAAKTAAYGRQQTDRGKRTHQRLRAAVLDHYGRACACCGEANERFLAIDHIDGGGRQHLKSLGLRPGDGFYRWLRNNNFPAGFRTLCHNCNQALGAYGVCHDAA